MKMDIPQRYIKKDYWILIGLSSLYIIFLLIMSVNDRFGLTWKTMVVPFLFFAALLSKKGIQFIKDWAIYLSLVILFDFLRGLVFALITRFELPVYMNYVIKIEMIIGRGKIYPVLLQNILQKLPISNILDRFFVVVHSSHFFVFLFFGLIVWLLKHEDFKKYILSMLILMYFGIIIYLILPTVPPWIAADKFQVIPPLKHITFEIYNTNLPVLQRSFDINPVAAMPSLHAAFPSLCCLVAMRHFSKRALPLIIYTILVFIAIIHLGEHYLIDVLAGISLSLAVFMLVYKSSVKKAFEFKLLSKIKKLILKSKILETQSLIHIMIFTMFFILISESVGLLTNMIRQSSYVTPNFIARELKDQKSIAEKFIYYSAFNRSKFKEEIIKTNTFIWNDNNIQDFLLMNNLLSNYPQDPEPMYWLTYFKLKTGKIDKTEALNMVKLFEAYDDKKSAKFFQKLLLLLIHL